MLVPTELSYKDLFLQRLLMSSGRQADVLVILTLPLSLIDTLLLVISVNIKQL